MSKYDALKILKRRQAKINHICFFCEKMIKNGEFYYFEELSDKLINYSKKKKLCEDCYKKFNK